MSLVNGEGLSAADVAAVTGGNGFNGFGGDGAWWLLVLFLFAFNGNWGGGYGNGGSQFVDSTVQRGFDQSAVMAGLSGIQNAVTSGMGDIQLGIAGINQNIMANQMASMQNAFNMQSQFSNCCCENRLGIANLGADIAREACADRQAISEGLMNLTAQNNANTNLLVTTINSGIQSLKDIQFQQQLDAERRENDNLRTQINLQNLAASQATQTAQLIADNTAQTQYIVNRVAPYPIPSYTVPNPFGTTTTTGA